MRAARARTTRALRSPSSASTLAQARRARQRARSRVPVGYRRRRLALKASRRTGWQGRATHAKAHGDSDTALAPAQAAPRPVRSCKASRRVRSRTNAMRPRLAVPRRRAGATRQLTRPYSLAAYLLALAPAPSRAPTTPCCGSLLGRRVTYSASSATLTGVLVIHSFHCFSLASDRSSHCRPVALERDEVPVGLSRDSDERQLWRARTRQRRSERTRRR